jgi:hypothetical protein
VWVWAWIAFGVANDGTANMAGDGVDTPPLMSVVGGGQGPKTKESQDQSPWIGRWRDRLST